MKGISFTSGQDSELAAIERRRQMAEMLRMQSMQPLQAQGNAPISPLSGAAKLLRGYGAARMGKQADTQEQQYNQSYQQALAAGLQGGGTGGDIATRLEQSGNPRAMELAAQLRIREAERQAELQQQQAVLTPDQEAQKIRIAQANKAPQSSLLTPEEEAQKLRIAQAGRAPSEAPSNVQEWQYYNSLPPEQKEEFLRMKRAAQWQDIGAQIVSPSMANPAAAPVATFEKSMTPDKAQDVKVESAKAEGKKNLATLPMKSLKTQVAELRDNPGLDNVTGWLAGRTPTFSQEGRNAQDLMDSIKSQISTAKLQSMRDASQTGGAVGQVTEREWPRLESAFAALGQSQDTETFKRRLNDVIRIIDESVSIIDKAYEATYGGSAAPAGDGWAIEEVK